MNTLDVARTPFWLPLGGIAILLLIAAIFIAAIVSDHRRRMQGLRQRHMSMADRMCALGRKLGDPMD